MNDHRPLALRRVSLLPAIAALAILAIVVSSCGASPTGATANHNTNTMVAGPFTVDHIAGNQNAELPSYVTNGDMRDSYRYALQHPDQLKYIPCYCGCGLTAEHKDNLACYIKGVDSAGAVAFDNHASFCSICLEITQDVARLSGEGKTLTEIRAYVDQTHGEKGPGTDTPRPPL